MRAAAARADLHEQSHAVEASIRTRLETDGAACTFDEDVTARDGPLAPSRPDDPTDDPFVPTRLVLCGLGACTAMTLRLFAASVGLDVGTISVVVTSFRHRGRPRLCRCVVFQRHVVRSDRLLLAAVCEKTPWTLLVKRRIPLHTEVF